MANNWNTETLPDDGIDVLVRVDDEELPIITGYHEDGLWWCETGGVIESQEFKGWMTVEEAAHILDSCNQLDGRVL